MVTIALIAADVNNLLSVPWWLYVLAVLFGGGEVYVASR
jgi:hypothetical protein